MKTLITLAGLASALLLACDGGGTGDGGTGGVVGAAGHGSGGVTTSGGSITEGGATGSGGVPASGGNTAAGGSGGVGTRKGSSGGGGTTSKGGNTGDGGTTGQGGKPGGGGTTSGGGRAGAGGTAGAGGAKGSGTACTREMLQGAVDGYLAAMEAGNATSLPLTEAATYAENGSKLRFDDGLWARPLPAPDLHMSLLDLEKCSSYTEIIVARGSHPYVLGLRLTVDGGQIAAASVIATDCDDWGFNASSYLRYSKAEQTNTAPGSGWGPVPADDQFTRAELQAAGDAYFAYWADKSVSVPWGYPCSRLEGGMATNPDPNPNPSSTCSVGIPDQSFAPKANDYLVDVDYGMVVLFLNMPGPDSHWFRATKSTLIRYIHTLTVCYVNGTWQCPGSAPTCS